MVSPAAGKGPSPILCRVCDVNPVAMSQVDYCFACWPGGPVTPPPCLACGSRSDYYAHGLCAYCHPFGDPGPGSCRDCLAFGVRRIREWLCQPCIKWRARYAKPGSGGSHGPCPGCGRTLTLGHRGVCRLCHTQTVYYRRQTGDWDPVAANRHGQQLAFANLPSPRAPFRRERVKPDPVEPQWPLPRDQQPTLFRAPPDIAAHGRKRLHLRAHPDDAEPLEALARHLAHTHHWTAGQRQDAIIGIKIMLGAQDDGRTPVRASEVKGLLDIDLPVWSVLQVLNTAGKLIEDRTPTIDRWFADRVDPLPEPMATELRTWFEIKKNGVNTAPRMRPRDPITIHLHLGWALPTLQAWAAAGHTSLREITRQDVLNALPPTGPQRPRVGQGLKSIFRLLKARKIIFVDPTARVKTGEHEHRIPLPLDPTIVNARLTSDSTVTNLVVALFAFHGLRLQQLQRLQLTDVVDGKLTTDGRTIPLAQPVRDRLAAYLTERNTRWPEALNPHLFINSRTWRTDRPAGPRYFHLAVGPGLTPRQLREDRIVNEAAATGGDVRALTDLFGLSTNASLRYLSTLEDDDLTPPEPQQRRQQPKQASSSRTQGPHHA